MKKFISRMSGVLLTAALALSGSARAADRPNVLFIAVDDLKPTIGAFGDAFAITPNLDKLAARGTAFTNAHCQQAVCAPSRVSLLTGLRPGTTRVWDLKTPFRPILPDVVTLPQRFKQAGYDVIGMGKIYDPRSAGGEKNMDRASWSQPYVQIDSPADATFGYLAPDVVDRVKATRAELDALPNNWDKRLKVVFPDGKPAIDCADVPDDAYGDGAMADVAVATIDTLAKGDKPFFLAVGFKKPHLPFNAPKKYWDLYERSQVPLAQVTEYPAGAPSYAPQPGWELRGAYANVPAEGALPEDMQRELVHGYYAATSYIDAQVGKVVAELEKQGIADNTIIVLWGDHGWHLGDHGMWCKHTNYEQATRAPLIIVAPGVGTPGKAAAPVEYVDVYPTLIDLAGIEASGELHGVSLRPILLDPEASVKDVAISEYPRGGGNNQRMGYAYRDSRYRLVQWIDFDDAAGKPTGAVVATELYDYQSDPLESRNLADDPAYAEAVERMRDKAKATGYPTLAGPRISKAGRAEAPGARARDDGAD